MKGAEMLRRTRRTFQHGWIERKESRRSELFVYRWRERLPAGGYRKRAIELGLVADLGTEAQAWREAERKQPQINTESPTAQVTTFGSLLDRYIAEELPYLRHSTRESYGCCIENHVTTMAGTWCLS
jgi:hypothetical protein